MSPLHFFLLAALGALSHANAQNWPQASGPTRNWILEEAPPTPSKWSVVREENLIWRTTMPEGGQSAVTVWGKHAFVTSYRPLEEGDSLKQPNLVGYCLEASTGTILWQVDLPGTDPVETAGIFSDATVFAPVTDGEHVWFFNRCGSVGCFDFTGQRIWLREYRPRPRHTNRQCEPILVDGLLLTVEVRDKAAGQQLKRHKPVPKGIEERDVWTYLHAHDARTGELRWVAEDATVVHSTPVVGRRRDGSWAVLHGRGGAHAPLEKPYGITMTDVATGKTLWSHELAPGGDCVFSAHWNERECYWFHKEDHLVLDTETGEILRTQNLMQSVDFTRFDPATKAWTTKKNIAVKTGKRHANTNQSNLVVGDWHYFLAHDVAALGRVHLVTGITEYLQLPVQKIAGASTSADQLIWDRANAIPSDVENSRGIKLSSDKRAAGPGFGHVSAASPIAVNGLLYVPIMNGTVFVIDAAAERLDDSALVAVNDLGPSGATWSLASLTASEGRLFAHTLKEILCLGER